MIFYLAMIEDKNDGDEFTLFYERHYQRMVRRAMRYATGRRFHWEDLMQETWFRVLRRFNNLRFSNEKSKQVYLYATMRASAVELINKENRQRAIEVPLEAANTLCYTTPDLAAEVCRAMTFDDIRKVAAAMTQTDREILSMVFGSGFSVRETADALGISLAAAEKRYARAKQHLIQELKKGGIINV